MHKDEAQAEPQKGFFINMLTKDITLADCILDLLDNCVDGANRHARLKDPELEDISFEGYAANIQISENNFSISDNCGGIPVQTAKDVAFNFGRPQRKPVDSKHSIGLYGIGMKRAIFKIGNNILITSSTGSEAFVAQITVEEWSAKNGWSFEIDVYDNDFPDPGTTVEIEDIYNSISNDFGNQAFISELMNTIARDYMFILSKGFKIIVNNMEVNPATLALVAGEEFRPLRDKQELPTKDGGSVNVEIIAGLWSLGEQDDDSGLTDFDSGWYVICNDRVVLAADKTEKTGWGKSKAIARKWHSQYKPFVGFAIFSSDDPKLLPWNTTKRGVDLSSEIYRQALGLMADATKPAIDYTNRRKNNITDAELAERRTTRESLLSINTNKTITFPVFEEKKIKPSTISFSVDERRLQKAKSTIGNLFMSNKEVGETVFEYYYSIEVGE